MVLLKKTSVMFFVPKTRAEEQKQSSRINSNHVQAVSSTYDVIFDAFPPNFGKLLSKKERSEKKLYDTALIYGEIEYETFGMRRFLTQLVEY